MTLDVQTSIAPDVQDHAAVAARSSEIRVAFLRALSDHLESCLPDDSPAAPMSRWLAGVLPGVDLLRRARVAAHLVGVASGKRFREAAEAAGVSWPIIQALEIQSPEYMEVLHCAKEVGRMARQERREREADRRGVEGWDEPVYGRDGFLGTVRRYSDRLLELTLKAGDPAKYGERRQVDHNVKGVVVQFHISGIMRHLDPADVDQQEAALWRRDASRDVRDATKALPRTLAGRDTEQSGQEATDC